MGVELVTDIKGWYLVEFTNSSTKQINIEHVINDMHGYIMYFVDHNKVVYNFNTVISFKKEGTYG